MVLWLMQAGTAAIVFRNENDRDEYYHYLNYLKRKKTVTKTEELKIGKLQGVQGLPALRATVNVYRSPEKN